MRHSIRLIVAIVLAAVMLPVAHAASDQARIATMTTSLGVIRMELLTTASPLTTTNFEQLVQGGFYDGVTFHRVIPGFMNQTGDPLSRDTDPSNDGMGGPGYTIADEFSDTAQHLRGTVAMAHTGQPNSAGSQFFINAADNHSLDGKYAIFAQVIDGMDVVDAINHVATDSSDRPLTPVVVQSITIADASLDPVPANTDAPGVETDRGWTLGSVLRVLFYILGILVVVLAIVLGALYIYYKRTIPAQREFKPEKKFRKKRHKTYGANK